VVLPEHVLKVQQVVELNLVEDELRTVAVLEDLVELLVLALLVVDDDLLHLLQRQLSETSSFESLVHRDDHGAASHDLSKILVQVVGLSSAVRFRARLECNYLGLPAVARESGAVLGATDG
jgi:HAMP domain-containing protein